MTLSETIITLVRSVIAFLTLFLFTRILSKQQISQLTFFEYVTGITIGSIASDLSVNLSTKGLGPWVGLAAWTFLTMLFQWAMTKNRKLAKVVEGEPAVIIQNGKLFHGSMRLLRYTLDDLMVQLREKNVFDISDVEFAVLEPNGTLSVLKKSQRQPVTPKDLNIATEYQGLPTEIIVDGKVVEQNLKQVQLDDTWLADELRRRGISSPDDVVYASLNTKGELYVALYDDRPAGATADISDFPGSQ